MWSGVLGRGGALELELLAVVCGGDSCSTECCVSSGSAARRGLCRGLSLESAVLYRHGVPRLWPDAGHSVAAMYPSAEHGVSLANVVVRRGTPDPERWLSALRPCCRGFVPLRAKLAASLWLALASDSACSLLDPNWIVPVGVLSHGPHCCIEAADNLRFAATSATVPLGTVEGSIAIVACC